MGAAGVRLLVGGELQDTPFLAEFVRALGRARGVARRTGAGVELRVEGLGASKASSPKVQARQVVTRAAKAAGVRATILHVRLEEAPGLEPGFHMLSPGEAVAGELELLEGVRADLAPCAACRKESVTEGRRRGYLRTECSACGPRYAHAQRLPLTRAAYGLEAMPPCGACTKEAHDPRSRRYAFERISCGDCGPTLTFAGRGGPPIVRGALEAAKHRLHAGEVVVVETPFGAYALALADKAAALRVELDAESAPFGLVVETSRAAAGFARLSPSERRALESEQAPELIVSPNARGEQIAMALAPHGEGLAVRLPDSLALAQLVAGEGAVACAPASHGGAFLPARAAESGALPTAAWLGDGQAHTDPVPPTRAYFLGARKVLLSHGRGTLPARALAGHDETVLAFGGGERLFGGLAFGGTVHLTGDAGPAARAASGERLKRLVSRAAALSPASTADRIDAVAVPPEEGTPARVAGEEAAESASCPVRVVANGHARAAAAGNAKFPAALVLTCDEPADSSRPWLGTEGTGGDLIDSGRRKVIGGIAPFEIVERPAGTGDLVAPLVSLLERAGVDWGSAARDDRGILEVMGTRAQTSTSFVLLVDGVAGALGIVPRHGPTGSGVAEVSRYLSESGFTRRFPMEAKLVSARGGRQVETGGLLATFADHWMSAVRREGHRLSADRRAALAASFTRALLDGLVVSTQAGLRKGPHRVALTGTAFEQRALSRSLIGRFDAAGIDAKFPEGIPVLDGAVALGQARLAGKI